MKDTDFHAETGFRIFEFNKFDFDSMHELTSSNNVNKAYFNKLSILYKLGPDITFEIMNGDLKIECFKNDFDNICQHSELIKISSSYKNKTKELGFDELDETIIVIFT